jgi:ferredoxin-NADP reductase
MPALTTLVHVRTATGESGISLLSFQADKPFHHTAGQYGLWLRGTTARPFTIASAPEDEFVQLATRFDSGSRVKRMLAALTAGDRIRFLGPIGKLAPPEDGRPIVFLAQGVGITPARSLLRRPSPRRRLLIHIGQPYFQDELQPLADQATYPVDRQHFVTALEKTVDLERDAHYLVSGSPAFVTSTTRALQGLAVDHTRIRSDSFLGLPDRSGTQDE